MGQGASPDGTWGTPTPPAPRSGHTAVWDPVDRQLLVFGGLAIINNVGTPLNDLWAYRPASNTWVELTPTGGPPPARVIHTAVWDPVNNQMLVFGGDGYSTPSSDLNDLWAYRPGSNTWVPISPATVLPSPRDGHTAVWDPTNAQMLIFGGFNGGVEFNDLWAYRPASNTWVQLSPTGTAPSARFAATAVWDPRNAQMLVFGGYIGAGGIVNDLWAYRPASNSWAMVTPATTSPPARYYHAAVWDPGNAQMLVFGGGDLGSTWFNDLWAYQPASNSWVHLSPTGGPPAGRVAPAATWDPDDAQMLVFGGSTSSARVNDLWAYRPATNSWSELDLTTLPSARYAQTAIWDPGDAQMLVFGGYGPYNNEVWAYRSGPGGWRRLAPTGGPPAVRSNQSAVWDPGNAQMLMFGGYNGSVLDDLWAYRPASNSWSPLAPAGGSPAARYGHTAVWDPGDRQMLVFGGYNGALLNDLWAYRPDTNSWVQLSPVGGTPTARFDHTAIWDTVKNQMLVFGGAAKSGSGFTYFNDLWVYRPGSNSWSQLAPTGGPPAGRSGHSAVWDPGNAQMLVFGGASTNSTSTTYLHDLWAYRPGTNSWVLRAPSGVSPSGRNLHTAVWNPGAAQMLVFGGESASGSLNDLWVYTPPPPPPPSPTPTASASPTPTRTPTITPTPYPRPNIGVQVAPSAGTLQSTITARDAGCPQGNNQLQALQFTRLTNTTVDVATVPPTHLAAPTTVSLPAHPASIGLTVHRVTPGQAATVELTVTDGCGAWPTFVGGGSSAF